MKAKPETRKPGRPAGSRPLTRILHVRLTEAEHIDLKARAAAEHRTITEVVKMRLFG